MTNERRPLVFLGTPDAAATVLRALVAAGCEIHHVITRPDAKRGRGGALSPSPVKEAAIEAGLSVSHDLDWITNHADSTMLGIVVAYGRIIPKDVLEIMPMINIHFSLLPRWRGAAPVERAILEGDDVTGVCIMDVEETLDTGAVYARAEMPISDVITASELTRDLSVLGAQLLVKTLNEGLGVPTPQSGEATYAAKITADDQRIDWNKSATDIVRTVRAVRAFTTVDGARLRIVEARLASEVVPNGHVSATGCVGAGNGAVQLVTVQPEGKQAMDVDSWLRGRASRPSTICI
jgi:methionyl-tRNA formyltransferase